MAMLACKFRQYSSRAAVEKLESALNGCRIIYNEMLGQMNEARENGTPAIDASDHKHEEPPCPS